ncbi:hypothetical protein D3C76_1412080 [compost metagenome]
MGNGIVDTAAAEGNPAQNRLLHTPALCKQVQSQRLGLILNLPDSILQTVIGQDGQYRAEYLLRHRGVPPLGRFQQSRLDIPLLPGHSSSVNDAGAVLLNHGSQPVKMPGIDNPPIVSAGGRILTVKMDDSLLHPPDQLILNR